jgi:hypothetical protein
LRIRTSVSALSAIFATLFGLVLVTFVIGRAMPIDPVLAIVGDRATPDVVARVREEMGLNKPLLDQFWIYLQHIVHGDFGTSVMTGQSVIADIRQFFPATLELATAAIFVAVLVGVPVGVLSAARVGSRLDGLVRVISLSGQSIPVFVLALLCLLVFYVRLGVAPGVGQQDVAYEGIVPFVTGALVSRRARTPRDAGTDARFCEHVDDRAHDPYLHAGRTGNRICRDGASQRTVADACCVETRVRQYIGATGRGSRARLRWPAGGLGVDRDGIQLARARSVPDPFFTECRYECRAGRDAGDRSRVRRGKLCRRRGISATRSAREVTEDWKWKPY